MNIININNKEKEKEKENLNSRNKYNKFGNTCYTCNSKIIQTIFFYNDNRFCSEFCRLKQMNKDNYLISNYV